MNARKKNDLIRTLLFVVVAAALLVFDVANIAVLQAAVVGVFLAIASHVTRRILFPDLDMQLIAEKASKEPTGAAIVFASVCLFLVAVMCMGMAVLS